jgi:hypothetical protein
MRLYHSHILWKILNLDLLHAVRERTRLFSLVIILWLLAGCSAPQATQASISVSISADGHTLNVDLPAGSNVQQALDAAHLKLDTLDRVEPPAYTLLTAGASIQVVRVREEFTVEQEVIPFERQVLQTESLPDKVEFLAQKGENGEQEITYRHVYEDGVEISKTPVRWTVVKDAVPEIRMVGIQTPFTPFPIPGRLVYLLKNNAWIMEQNTGNRRPLITTGDLDGRVLSLSTDGTWLLFTRRSKYKYQINTLWAAKIDSDPIEMINLKVSNVVHFADWVPDSTVRVAYSTVEPRLAAPGWQSNNDLNYLSIYKSGAGSFSTVDIKESIGGSYGWWGVNFLWAPDGTRLAFGNSNGVGLLGTKKEETPVPLLGFAPFQTRSDWAWIPGISWSPDGQVIYSVDHVAPPGSASPEESQTFDLAAIPLQEGLPVRMVSNVGMFAYPAASPSTSLPSGEESYQVAFLQAIFPTQSETSRYRLVVMDRDGSNRKVLFPPDGEPGLEPQQVVWSPGPMPEGNFSIAVVYQGNLWMVDVGTGNARQITGDGLTSRIAWKSVH